jgi:ferric-dicitrate binding protein FerR (iron transport regulator)
MPFDQDHIEQLIVQKLVGEITPKENEELELLIQENESARSLWLDMKNAHDIFAAGTVAKEFDDKRAWEKIEGQLIVAPSITAQKTPTTFFTRKRSIAFAALLFVIAVGAAVFLFNQKDKTPAIAYNGIVLKMSNGKTIEIPHGEQNMNVEQSGNDASFKLTDGSVLTSARKENLNKEEYNTIFVPAGKDYHMILPDGSEVWLNALTEFKFPLSFSGDTRTVSIKGEGFFKVAQQSNKPFIVKSPEMNVKVLGTEFNIKCYEDEPEKTSLVTGKVALHAHNGKDTVLIPGKEAEIDNGKFKIADFEEDVTLSWLKGIYVFNNQDLRHLQSIIKRWYDMEVIIEEETLANKRFTGTVEKNKPIEEFLNSLTKSSDVKFHVQNKQVVFHSK